MSNTQHGRGTGVPHPIDITVGQRLRMRRKLIGLSQENLAEKVGLTFQQVQKYERGVNRVSASRLAQFADILGVSVSFFFAEEERNVVGMLEDPGAMRLLKAYTAIDNAAVRQAIADAAVAFAAA